MRRWLRLKTQRPDITLPRRGAKPLEILSWLAVAAAWTAAWCWLSVLLAERFAPVIVLPLLAGLVLGAGFVLAMRLTGLGSRPWLLAGTLVLSLGLAAGEHYVWYRMTQAKLDEGYAAKLSGNKFSALAATIPNLHPSFVGFLHETAARGRGWFSGKIYGGWVWASWALDAALQSAAAVALVWIFAGLPYCAGCRSWYRMIRNGKLDRQQAAALAALCGREGSAPGEYRLLHCRSGCGPIRLELIGPNAQSRCSTWLDGTARRRVLEVLDAPADEHVSAAETPQGLCSKPGCDTDSSPETPQ